MKLLVIFSLAIFGLVHGNEYSDGDGYNSDGYNNDGAEISRNISLSHAHQVNSHTDSINDFIATNEVVTTHLQYCEQTTDNKMELTFDECFNFFLQNHRAAVKSIADTYFDSQGQHSTELGFNRIDDYTNAPHFVTTMGGSTVEFVPVYDTVSSFLPLLVAPVYGQWKQLTRDLPGGGVGGCTKTGYYYTYTAPVSTSTQMPMCSDMSVTELESYCNGRDSPAWETETSCEGDSPAWHTTWDGRCQWDNDNSKCRACPCQGTPAVRGTLYQYKGKEVSVCKSQDSSFKLCKRNTAAELQQLKSGMCGNSTASQSELKTALKTAYQQLGYCNSTT